MDDAMEFALRMQKVGEEIVSKAPLFTSKKIIEEWYREAEEQERKTWVMLILAHDAAIHAESAKEIAAWRDDLDEMTRLFHATQEIMSDNLHMACRLARWRDLLLAERDESRKEIASLKDVIREMLSSEYDSDPRIEYVEVQIDKTTIADARELLKEEPK